MVQLIDAAEHLVPHVCYLDAAQPVDPSIMNPVTGQLDTAPFDWVVSVEVGEHIPSQKANIFLDNLVSLADLAPRNSRGWFVTLSELFCLTIWP